MNLDNALKQLKCPCCGSGCNYNYSTTTSAYFPGGFDGNEVTDHYTCSNCGLRLEDKLTKQPQQGIKIEPLGKSELRYNGKEIGSILDDYEKRLTRLEELLGEK